MSGKRKRDRAKFLRMVSAETHAARLRAEVETLNAKVHALEEACRRADNTARRLIGEHTNTKLRRGGDGKVYAVQFGVTEAMGALWRTDREYITRLVGEQLLHEMMRSFPDFGRAVAYGDLVFRAKAFDPQLSEPTP